MIIFEHAWLAVLAPAPLLVQWFAAAYHTPLAALRAPFFNQLLHLSGQKPSLGAAILKRNKVQQLVLALSWLAIICALAKPMWIGEPIVQQQPARDLMIAVDLSGSMAAEDFQFAAAQPVSRLHGVKQIIAQFVDQRQSDRFGLIVFASMPYLQVPFTQDHTLFKQLLEQAQVGMAGPKTMLGDAIGLAIKHFASADGEHKVLILLTDGNDTESRVPPLEAARVAADADITIHTIAIGDPSAVGEQRMDVLALQRVSQISGGVFFKAQTAQQLQAIYDEIDQLEPQQVELVSYRPKTSLFHWPLGFGLMMQIMLRLIMLIANRPGRRTVLSETVDDA